MAVHINFLFLHIDKAVPVPHCIPERKDARQFTLHSLLIEFPVRGKPGDKMYPVAVPSLEYPASTMV